MDRTTKMCGIGAGRQGTVAIQFWRYSLLKIWIYSGHNATSFPGSSLYFEKVPWLRLVTCPCMPTQPHRGWVLNLILLTLCREVNVALLYRRYIWKGSKLFVRNPAWPAASALPEPLWVWDVDWEGTLLIFHCFFKWPSTTCFGLVYTVFHTKRIK